MKLFKIFVLSIVIILFAFSLPAFCAQFKKARTIGSEEFMFLCKSGSAEEISNALKSGASAFIAYNDGTTTLMETAKGNSPEAVQVLLGAGVNVNAKNSDGNTALLLAAQSNYYAEVIDVLIEAGAEDTSNKNGETALMLAARSNSPEVVLTLVKAGADLSAKSSTGETALSIARARKEDAVINALFNFYELCEKGSAEEISQAIKGGAVVNADYDSRSGYTPLIIATTSNTPQAVEILIKAGANVDVGDHYGETPLAIAARIGSTEKIEILLNANADTLLTQYFEGGEEEGEQEFEEITPLEVASANEKLKGTEALKHLRAKFEDQSKAETQYNLGAAYYDKRYLAEAFKWFKRAADQKESRSQYIIALMYKDGIGVTKDENEFQKFQKMAADNGHAQAQVELGKKFAQTFSNIITNTQMFSYSGAEEDKLRNFSQSFKYYSMAAEKGNADAQFGIAKLLERYSVHPVYDVENIFADHVNLNVLGAEDVEILDNFFRALSINGTVADARNSKEEKERLRSAIHDVNRGDGLGPSTGPLILKWYREAARNGHKEAQKYLEDRKRLGLLTE